MWCTSLSFSHRICRKMSYGAQCLIGKCPTIHYYNRGQRLKYILKTEWLQCPEPWERMSWECIMKLKTDTFRIKWSHHFLTCLFLHLPIGLLLYSVRNIEPLSQMDWNWYEHCWIGILLLFQLKIAQFTMNVREFVGQTIKFYGWKYPQILPNTISYVNYVIIIANAECIDYTFPYHSIFFQMP